MAKTIRATHKLTPGEKKLWNLGFLPLVHKINHEYYDKLSKKSKMDKSEHKSVRIINLKKKQKETLKETLLSEFKKKSQIICHELKKVNNENKQKQREYLIMYAMNNVWWAISRLPWDFLKYFFFLVFNLLDPNM